MTQWFIGDRGFVTLWLREDYRGGGLGPELLVAGPPVTRSAGHCWFLVGEADTDGELLAAVAQRARRGVDWVKVIGIGGLSTAGSDPFQPVPCQKSMRRR
jgi:hypothetical protein